MTQIEQGIVEPAESEAESECQWCTLPSTSYCGKKRQRDHQAFTMHLLSQVKCL